MKIRSVSPYLMAAFVVLALVGCASSEATIKERTPRFRPLLTSSSAGAKALLNTTEATIVKALQHRHTNPLLALGENMQAAQGALAALKANPNDEDARRFLAEVNMGARRYAEAVRDFETLLTMRPRDAKYLNNLAWLYQQLGDKRALATAQEAYILLPVADVADTLGWILLADGASPTAVVLLRQAYGEAGNDPRIAYHYAVALQEAGQAGEAGKVLKPVVDSGIRFDERDDAIELLADLSKGS